MPGILTSLLNHASPFLRFSAGAGKGAAVASRSEKQGWQAQSSVFKSAELTQ